MKVLRRVNIRDSGKGFFSHNLVFRGGISFSHVTKVGVRLVRNTGWTPASGTDENRMCALTSRPFLGVLSAAFLEEGVGMHMVTGHWTLFQM